MAAILTAEDVVRRIAAECAYVDERGGGIRLEPAAAIVRQYGEQFRRRPRRSLIEIRNRSARVHVLPRRVIFHIGRRSIVR
jgi:hypothetical protein